MSEYTRVPLRQAEHERLVALTISLAGKIDSYLTRPSYSDVIKFLLDHYEGKNTMSNYPIHNITVKADIEGASGKSLANPNSEKFQIRFWLETQVNGKTAKSRGTVVTVEQPTLADARQFARQKAAYVNENLYQWAVDQGIANVTAKDAANKLPELVNTAVQDDLDWQKAIDELASK